MAYQCCLNRDRQSVDFVLGIRTRRRRIAGITRLTLHIPVFKYGPSLASFRPFLNTMTNIGCTKFDYNWKKHIWRAWDSNPGPQDGRHGRIY